MTASGELAIAIEHAGKVYRALGKRPKHAVADVSLRVHAGTIHGLLGPNGAGKTTTLKMLLGLVKPSAGTFRVLGEDATRPAGRARIGFLPEQPYFPTHLTAMQTLEFYGVLGGLTRAEARSQGAGLLERVGLEDSRDIELRAFSRGMLQRLGIAQALLGSPKVVVLDEPASGLDPVGQRDVRNLMLSLRAEGVTILLSSHQLSEVEAVCDRVTILDRGRVAAEGHIDDLLNVRGRTSVTVRGIEALPVGIAALADDVAVFGSRWVFSVPEASIRQVVDVLDDAGGTIVAISPKRESLEDYFARLLTRARAEEVA